MGNDRELQSYLDELEKEFPNFGIEEDDEDDIYSSTSMDAEYVKTMAQDDYDFGHPVEDYDEFSKILEDDGVQPTEELYSLYIDTLDSFGDEEEEDY